MTEPERDGAPALDLGETGPKGLDNAVYAITELNKYFKERLTPDNPRFVQHYIESKLHALVRFRISFINEEFFASFERKKVIGGWHLRLKNPSSAHYRR